MSNILHGQDGILPPSSLVGRQELASTSYTTSVPTTAALSTGAIAGIAVGGAALLFAALAPLLIKLAKRQDQRRARASALSEGVMANLESGDVLETDEADGTTADRPKRLRKKSTVDSRVSAVAMIDKEDDVGREESHSRRSSLQQVSPARSRVGGGSSFTEKSGGRRSVETTTTQGGSIMQKQRSPEKQRGYGLYEHRRTSSWIDEDAIHGPTVTSPQRQKQKQKQKSQFSWLGGGISRSLSRLSVKSGTTERMGSPTLPYTEGDGEKQKQHQYDANNESPNRQSTRDSGSLSARSSRHTLAPRLSHPQQQQQLVYSSPQKPYLAISLPNPGLVGPNNLAKSPPDIIQNPRFRNRVSFQAAHQLAGGARLPAPISIPQMHIPSFQQQQQQPRKPILKHSTTDTDLTEILRMTAERLQDGHRSARRQTLMVPYQRSGRPGHEGNFSQGSYYYYHYGYGYDSNGNTINMTYEPSSGEVSPVKSHKSAPATLAYAAELEASPPKPTRSQSPQRQVQMQMQTPRHSRQISHLSAISMISEPDSLVASKRESLQEVRTALSSPSRVARSTEPSPSPQGAGDGGRQMRPFSIGSSLSSHLSTLYSMEEASIRSPPMGSDVNYSSVVNDDDDDDASRRAAAAGKKLSAFDIFNGNSHALESISPRFRFVDDEDEENDKPAPLRVRRGTLGGRVVGTNSLPASQPGSPIKKNEQPGPPANRSSFPVYAMNGNDDPFTAVPTPQNPARLSKVFSPLPVELPLEDDDDITEVSYPLRSHPTTQSNNASLETPTPSPSRRRALALPSPRTILNSPTMKLLNNTDQHRPSSPVISEAGLSSVYDSYTYSHSETGAAPEEDSSTSNTTTPTLATTAFPPTSSSPAKSAHLRTHSRNSNSTIPPSPATGNLHRNTSGRESRISFRTPNYTQEPRRLASDGSVYSQDQSASEYDQDHDQVPPLQRAPTLKSNRSVRMSTAVAELRRMNSQISVVSSAASIDSNATLTLPAMRGGGFSPERQGGGGKNYLSLGGGLLSRGGSPEKLSGVRMQPPPPPMSPVRRSTVRRTKSRRGTVVYGAGNKMQRVDEAGSVPRGGSPSKMRFSDMKSAGQLLTQATKLRHQDSAGKRGSVESLYDQQGFLK